jgi:histidine triad (HIT) family protein
METIFTRIINKEIPAQIEYEDEHCIVIHDIHPKSDVHLLIIPKKPIPTIMHLEDEEQALVGHLFLVARNMGKKFGLEGYKLQFNVGEKGGQEVMHIHLHLLG